VRIGTPDQVEAFRRTWIERARGLAAQLMLPCVVDVASDRFFGRIGTLMANSQREQELKFEVLIPVNPGAEPTACCSVNYHLDHFGAIWDLATAGGERCHTACIGFGLERLTLAMFRHHGLDSDAWPAGLRDLLRGTPA
jgi:seryl-tRNA synthetase